MITIPTCFFIFLRDIPTGLLYQSLQLSWTTPTFLFLVYVYVHVYIIKYKLYTRYTYFSTFLDHNENGMEQTIGILLLFILYTFGTVVSLNSEGLN